jgi:hypothetical protein
MLLCCDPLPVALAAPASAEVNREARHPECNGSASVSLRNNLLHRLILRTPTRQCSLWNTFMPILAEGECGASTDVCGKIFLSLCAYG